MFSLAHGIRFYIPVMGGSSDGDTQDPTDSNDSFTHKHDPKKKEKAPAPYIFPKRVLNAPTLAGLPRRRKAKIRLRRKDFEQLHKVKR